MTAELVGVLVVIRLMMFGVGRKRQRDIAVIVGGAMDQSGLEQDPAKGCMLP